VIPRLGAKRPDWGNWLFAIIFTMKTKKINPFYPLLILVGIIFFISATSYGVMAIRETSGTETTANQTGLLGFMNQYGDWLLIIEVLLLGFLTVAAIGTDEIAGRSEQKTDDQIAQVQNLETSTSTKSKKGIEL
jgi:hypothetical protein